MQRLIAKVTFILGLLSSPCLFIVASTSADDASCSRSQATHPAQIHDIEQLAALASLDPSLRQALSSASSLASIVSADLADLLRLARDRARDAEREKAFSTLSQVVSASSNLPGV